MSWQPIDTAPKDGTVVLVWTRTGYHLAVYFMVQPEGWMEKDGNYLLAEDTTGLPTYWMPLSVPPSSNGDTRGVKLGHLGRNQGGPLAAPIWPFGPDELYCLSIARG